MKSIRRNRFSLFVVVCALVLVTGVAAAFGRVGGRLLRANDTARPEVKVTLAGTVGRDGGEVALDKAGIVHPGEVLNWRISSENEGTGPAREYKAVGQIPKGTLLIAGSIVADGNPTVTYSIDNGQTYSAQPTIEEQQPDGSAKKVSAPVSMYTQVRYEWSDALSAGSKLNASYKVRVK